MDPWDEFTLPAISISRGGIFFPRYAGPNIETTVKRVGWRRWEVTVNYGPHNFDRAVQLPEWAQKPFHLGVYTTKARAYSAREHLLGFLLLTYRVHARYIDDCRKTYGE